MGTIDDYLADLDPASRDAIEHVYAVARTVVPDAEQGKGYGMPALVYRGKSLIAVMRAKTHIGVYPFSADVVATMAPQLAGFSLDKGTIRFQPDEPLPDEAVVQLVELRRAQIDGAGKAPVGDARVGNAPAGKAPADTAAAGRASGTAPADKAAAGRAAAKRAPAIPG